MESAPNRKLLSDHFTRDLEAVLTIFSPRRHQDELKVADPSCLFRKRGVPEYSTTLPTGEKDNY